MDPCTQGILGVTLACSVANKNSVKVASICGLTGGLAPDLDILITSTDDPLLFIEYHRHFSHSLIFVPLGALIISLFLFLFFKKNYSFKEIYLYSSLGMLTHGLLDSFTSYGTNLFWPFSNSRVAWNVISIIDPIYTFILLFFLVLFFLRKKIFLIRMGLFLSIFYLGFGFIKHDQVKKYVKELAEVRKHKIERLILNPTIGNNILWRTVYQAGENYYIDAVYMPISKMPSHKEGKIIKFIDKETIFPELSNTSKQRQDIKRFSYFSQDYIYLHPEHKNVIADLRYGTLPYDDKSLWGIRIDVKDMNKHVTFENLRNFNDEHYKEFWLMLRNGFN